MAVTRNGIAKQRGCLSAETAKRRLKERESRETERARERESERSNTPDSAASKGKRRRLQLVAQRPSQEQRAIGALVAALPPVQRGREAAQLGVRCADRTGQNRNASAYYPEDNMPLRVR